MTPALSAIVVHWRNERHLAELIAAWPNDPRFELIVVDNSPGGPSRGQSLPDGSGSDSNIPVRWLTAGGNLGFAGGVNFGAEAARSDLFLILNPDAVPEPGALEALLTGFKEHPECAGLAPRLLGDDAKIQWHWQLRSLPEPGALLLEPLGRRAGRAPAAEPAAGTLVEQPAAAALAVRRSAFERIGGFDPAFFPAWFEDVDFARRLIDSGKVLRYWPAAEFRHGLGASVPRLGYQTFLWCYYRNLTRYLAKHHGRGWEFAARAAIVAGMIVRMGAVLLRKPRRATSRSEAIRALLGVARGAIGGWRHAPNEVPLGPPAGPPAFNTVGSSADASPPKRSLDPPE